MRLPISFVLEGHICVFLGHLADIAAVILEYVQLKCIRYFSLSRMFEYLERKLLGQSQ
jgi:hypothetical protein